MHRDFHRDAPGGDDPIAGPFGQLYMVAVAWAKVAAGLRDTYYRFARPQFLEREPVVQVSFNIKRGHLWVVEIVEPLTGAQRFGVGHVSSFSGRSRQGRQ